MMGGVGHGVVTSTVERVAADEAQGDERHGAQDAVGQEGLLGVSGAGGHEAAGRREQRGAHGAQGADQAGGQSS